MNWSGTDGLWSFGWVTALVLFDVILCLLKDWTTQHEGASVFFFGIGLNICPDVRAIHKSMFFNQSSQE